MRRRWAVTHADCSTAVPPMAFASMVGMLARTELSRSSRLIVEKPLARTSRRPASSTTLSMPLSMSPRCFASTISWARSPSTTSWPSASPNGLFEPIWNRDHINRRSTYRGRLVSRVVPISRTNGAFRDMVVTHSSGCWGFVAMEPPASLTAKHLRDENTKVFEAMPPLDVTRVVRGQYRGYQKEPGVDPRSQTETFIAACVEVDNSRWSGVPFFLRTGKSLEERRLVVTLGFKSPTMRMFALDPNIRKARRSNKLVIDFNDPGAIVAHFLAKEPGAAMRLGEATMTFRYADSFSRRHELEGYERLILDAMLGDHSLFTRSEDVERLWEVSTPLLDHPPPVEPYTPGSWGPDSIRHLISPHHWYLPDTP